MNHEQAMRWAQEMELKTFTCVAPNPDESFDACKVEDVREAIAAALVKYTQGQEPVAKIIGTGGVANLPLLIWLSADHSFRAPIGSLLYPAPSQQEEPHPPHRQCGCPSCLPSFDDNATPPRQQEELCEDEGCPHHGTEHICVSGQQEACEHPCGDINCAVMCKHVNPAPSQQEERRPLTFEQAWAEYEAKGYRYGKDALEQVRFGWNIAHNIKEKK